jgi:Sigma-70 region 2
MDQDHRSLAPDHAGFDATSWSLVLEAARTRAEGGPEALARLCERYWPPLYAFARHRGFNPEDAQDLVQGFFEHLIESRALGAVDKAKGRFRSFLLVSLQNFAAMECRRANTKKRGGGAQMIRIERHADSGNGLRRSMGGGTALPGHPTPGTGAGRTGQSRSLLHAAALFGRSRDQGRPKLRSSSAGAERWTTDT